MMQLLTQPYRRSACPSTETVDNARTPVPVSSTKLLVLRGCKIGMEFPIYEGRNTIGRFAEKPVDIDLN